MQAITGLVLVIFALLPIAGQAQEYRVLNTIATQGVVHILHADSASRRLYAGRENALDIHDMDSGAIIKTLSVQGTVAGIALAAQRNQGYISLAESGQILTFDLATLDVVRSTRTGAKQPGELAYDPAHGKLYISHAGDGVLVALDAETGRRAGSLTLGGRLRGLALDGREKLFIADEINDVLHVVDTAKLRSLGQIPLWPGRAPVALANDTRERRL